MRATVLRDAARTRRAGRFVWLEVDTEKPENAAFLEAFPIDSYPTFLVVDPATGKAALKWIGSATAAERPACRWPTAGRRAISRG